MACSVSTFTRSEPISDSSSDSTALTSAVLTVHRSGGCGASRSGQALKQGGHAPAACSTAVLASSRTSPIGMSGVPPWATAVRGELGDIFE